MLAYVLVFFRLTLFVFLVLVGLITTLILFPIISWKYKRFIIKAWSRTLLRALGLRLVIECAPVAENLHGLMVSNHSSWIDIFASNTVQAVRFISKSEIREWPVLGTLVTMAGTLYVERGNRSKISETNVAIGEAVRSGDLVGFYPEGTTTDGRYLLPFKTNLFQPAIDFDMTVYPVAVRYFHKGAPTHLASYEGEMTFMQSLLSITRTWGLEAHIHYGDPIQSSDYPDRASLAQASQDAIVRITGFEVRSPTAQQTSLLQTGKIAN